MVSISASADPIPALARFLGAQLHRVPEAVLACTEEHPEEWDIHFISMNLSPYVSFGVPGLASIDVTPEIEFVWTRGDGGDTQPE